MANISTRRLELPDSNFQFWTWTWNEANAYTSKWQKIYIARNIHLLGSTEVAISLVSNINQSTPSSLDWVLNSQSELTECSITIIGNFQLMKDNSDVDMPYSELLHTICRHIPELTAPFIRPVIWMNITLLSQYKLDFYAESSKK